MDFRMDDNEQMVHDLCTRFAREQLAEAGAEADRACETPASLIEKGMELGLFLDAVPEARGGYLEGSYSQTQRVVRLLALARGCAGVTLRFEANTEFSLAVAALGGEAEALLDDLADPTQQLACTAFADDLRPLRVDGGRLHGRISAVPNALGAVAIAVVGAEDGPEAPFVAVVRGDAAGLSVEDARPMGLTAAAVGNLSFEGVTPVALLEGEAARTLAGRLRASARLLAGSLAVGAGFAGLDYAEAYAADRVQFGQPIGRFQSMQRMLAENRARLSAAQYLLLAGAQALDHGEPAADLSRHATHVAGEAGVLAAIDAVQIYGGYGYVNEYPVEKLMRDTRACTTLAGDGLREHVLLGSVA